MSDTDWFMKKPCKNCPFRNDVKPFLTAEFADELACSASNPYNTFYCHETTEGDEDFGGEGSEMVAVESSKMCAGFLAMQITEAEIEAPDGFTPAWDIVYNDYFDMTQAYEDAGL